MKVLFLIFVITTAVIVLCYLIFVGAMLIDDFRYSRIEKRYFKELDKVASLDKIKKEIKANKKHYRNAGS